MSISFAKATTNPLLKMGVIQAPMTSQGAPGHELIDLRTLGLFPAVMGGEGGGYHTEGDLVTVTADGIDLNEMWTEFQQTLDIFNERRQALISMLTYPVQQLIENVSQVGQTEFEEASEFGIPKSARLQIEYLQMAYDFKDYDLATRFTWKFLRDADARQVEAVHRSILDADNRLIFRKVMEAIFDDRGRKADINRQNYNVYPLYNADGMVPPPYKTTTFDGTHSHYMVGGAALTGGISLIDSEDLEAMLLKITEHGYTVENGTRFVAIMNTQESEEVRQFRAGAVNNNGVVASYDFIPGVDEPALIVPNAEGLIGNRPPSRYQGLPVFGSYKGILLVEEDYIPPGYVLMFGTGGRANLQNVVGLREHQNAAYRGLRLLPGNQQRYPLVDSYYSRGFGTGVRQRGAAVVMQLKPSGDYEPPASYTRGGGLV